MQLTYVRNIYFLFLVVSFSCLFFSSFFVNKDLSRYWRPLKNVVPDTPQALDANNPFINLREQKWMAMILDYTAKCFF